MAMSTHQNKNKNINERELAGFTETVFLPNDMMHDGIETGIYKCEVYARI
jgi:hypothetical protein